MCQKDKTRPDFHVHDSRPLWLFFYDICMSQEKAYSLAFAADGVGNEYDDYLLLTLQSPDNQLCSFGLFSDMLTLNQGQTKAEQSDNGTFTHSARLRKQFSCARTLQQEVWTFLKWTGSYSSILRITPKVRSLCTLCLCCGMIYSLR